MILYLTGTGNSRWVAEQLAEATHDTAVDLADYIRRGVLPPGLDDAIDLGIVFPIHSWRAPRVLTDFLSRCPLPEECYHYAVCTCGDDAGKAMDLFFHYFSLDAAWSVVMPNTYVPMFDLDSDALCCKKLENARRELDVIAEEILCGRVEWRVHEGDHAWLKSHVLNPLFTRFIISSRGFHVDKGCVSCGKCVDSCPMANIRLVEGRPVWGKACIHCMACLHACPQEVIQYKRATQKKGRYRLEDYL